MGFSFLWLRMSWFWIRSIFERWKCPIWTWSPRVLLGPKFFGGPPGGKKCLESPEMARKLIIDCLPFPCQTLEQKNLCWVKHAQSWERVFPQWVATEKNDDALLTNCICSNWKLEQKEKIEICTDVSVALTSCCGRLCALWECPHVSSDGGDLDHVLPLLSPRVLVHHQALVPREVPPQLPCQADVGTATGSLERYSFPRPSLL